jgi:hypothetical protein
MLRVPAGAKTQPDLASLVENPFSCSAVMAEPSFMRNASTSCCVAPMLS